KAASVDDRASPGSARHKDKVLSKTPLDGVPGRSSKNSRCLGAGARHSLGLPRRSFPCGSLYGQDDPVRALMLLREAQAMVTDPQRQARYYDAIAWLYSLAVLRDLHASDPRFQMGPAIDL